MFNGMPHVYSNYKNVICIFFNIFILLFIWLRPCLPGEWVFVVTAAPLLMPIINDAYTLFDGRIICFFVLRRRRRVTLNAEYLCFYE